MRKGDGASLTSIPAQRVSPPAAQDTNLQGTNVPVRAGGTQLIAKTSNTQPWRMRSSLDVGCPAQAVPPLCSIPSKVCPLLLETKALIRGLACRLLWRRNGRKPLLCRWTDGFVVTRHSSRTDWQETSPSSPPAALPTANLLSRDRGSGFPGKPLGRRARPVRGFCSFLPEVPAERTPSYQQVPFCFCWRTLKPDGQGMDLLPLSATCNSVP